MNSIIDYLRQEIAGIKRTVYPITKEKAVYDDENNRLDQKLSGIQEQLAGVSTEIDGTIDSAITRRAGEDIATKKEVQEAGRKISDIKSGTAKAGSAGDSDRLGGQLPEYYAKAEAINALTQNVEGNTGRILQLSNPNILINPDFRINQRNRLIYEENGKYTVDRWRIGAPGVRVTTQEYGVQIEKTLAGYHCIILQPLEQTRNIGQTLTLRVKLRTNSDNAYIQIRPNERDRSAYVGRHEDWHIASVSCEEVDNITSLAVAIGMNDAATVGEYVEVAWAKLETGKTPTPFVPPDPATELMKCQRYYLDSYSNEGYFIRIDSEREGDFFHFPVEMRTIPDIKVSGEGMMYIIDTTNTNVLAQVGFWADGGAVFTSGFALVDRVMADAEIY